MAEPQLSNEELFQSTQDVLAEAFDDLKKEDDSDDEVELDLHTPTYDEAENKEESKPEEKEEEEADVKVEPEESASAKVEEENESPEVEIKDEDILSNLKPKAQERFKDLVSRTKDLETQLEEMMPSNKVAEHVLTSGTQPDQLNFALDIFKNLNSGDWESARSALSRIDEFSNAIAEKLGVSESENDKANYSDFEDLNNAVENLEISQDWANKLAYQRIQENSINQSKNSFNEYNDSVQQQSAAYEQEQNQAYNAIKDWENGIRTKDADFESKRDIMLDIGEKIVNSGVNPSSWLPLLQNEYEVLSRGMSLASPGTNARKNTGPLAPSRSSGGSSDADDLKTAEVTPEFLQYHLDQLNNR